MLHAKKETYNPVTFSYTCN